MSEVGKTGVQMTDPVSGKPVLNADNVDHDAIVKTLNFSSGVYYIDWSWYQTISPHLRGQDAIEYRTMSAIFMGFKALSRAILGQRRTTKTDRYFREKWSSQAIGSPDAYGSSFTEKVIDQLKYDEEIQKSAEQKRDILNAGLVHMLYATESQKAALEASLADYNIRA